MARKQMSVENKVNRCVWVGMKEYQSQNAHWSRQDAIFCIILFIIMHNTSHRLLPHLNRDREGDRWRGWSVCFLHILALTYSATCYLWEESQLLNITKHVKSEKKYDIYFGATQIMYGCSFSSLQHENKSR
jgi:hypothetical protein